MATASRHSPRAPVPSRPGTRTTSIRPAATWCTGSQPAGWTAGQIFNTTTAWKKAKEWVDGLIAVGSLVAGMLLLSDPDPTVSKVLGGVLVAAVIARSSVAIYERIRDGGDALSTENILDGIAIVTSFMGLSGGVLRGIGVGVRNPTVYRVGNWMIMSAVAADVGTFIYASSEAIATLKTIQADPTLDDGQKSMEMMRIMASLFLSGAMLLVANKDLIKKGIKPSDFIKSEIKPGMKPELDIGTRLDAEYELKKGGAWNKETPKLSNEDVLNKVFNQRSRQEIEANLAKKGAKPEDIKALTAAFGDDGMIELGKTLGERFPDEVAASGAAPLVTLKNKFGARAAARLTAAVGGKQLPKTVSLLDDIMLHLADQAESGDYRWGGTGKTEKAMAGGNARVVKSADPATGGRSLSVEGADGTTIKLTERGRYDDVRIDPTKLSSDDQAAFDKLFSDFGITDPKAKAKVYEAVENARIRKPDMDIPTAIKKEARPLLAEADAAAKTKSSGGTPTTAQEVVAGKGDKTPLVPEDQAPALKEAQQHIDDGILKDPAFQSARTLEEGRDALAQNALKQTGRQRAEAGGASGGKVLTKIRFVGDMYPDKTSTTPKTQKSGNPIVNTDVIPDVDVAYVNDSGGGKLSVKYIGNAKINKPSASTVEVASAQSQNARNKSAIEAGSNRFETTTVRGETGWAEIKKVTAVDETGATIDVTGKLQMDPAAKLETIGAPGAKGFDATMAVPPAKTMDKIVEAIWRLAEMAKR